MPHEIETRADAQSARVRVRQGAQRLLAGGGGELVQRHLAAGGCLQPHSAHVAVNKRDAHVPHPPGRGLGKLALEAAKQVGVRINPNVAMEQMSFFAPGSNSST